ncbi:hypothetical protein GCM10010991_07800 [Gemmobacter aquaticus]|uniref:Uncharacterized protein n=1 Tax=Gemmobacter aquaticus TaxID=490185 RepID=A0A918DB99_9RHOB|nr:hypothetical protein [Gemmobacter aquaticus]GGO26799.1 hypothetical protein GCM10010991_07800 [Gemmobacter aquaticus]
MSRLTLNLSKPKKGSKIDPVTLGYIRGRNRNKMHSFILKLLRDSGMTKTDVAEILGKRPEQMTRWFGGPGNMTIDTISDIVFAISGSFVHISEDDAHKTAPPRNRRSRSEKEAAAPMPGGHVALRSVSSTADTSNARPTLRVIVKPNGQTEIATTESSGAHRIKLNPVTSEAIG